MHRKIIHIDMDAFYASVEQRDNPELRGKPVAVGWGGKRGVVAAASYEARQFGVRSALPSMTAKKLCPGLIFVKPRFDQYKLISTKIRGIFQEYTDLVEPLSLDEAYLDVTHNKKGYLSATHIAREIRERIFSETQLTASAGISINKFLAKVASDINKPNGITLIPPDRAEAFLEKLPVEKFFGIGKVTAEKMKKLGLRTGADIKSWTELELARKFGKMGRHYYKIVRARDERLVKPDRLGKSVGIENTFLEDMETEAEMLVELKSLTEKLCDRLQKVSTKTRTITLKIKYFDFELKTRSKSYNIFMDEAEQIFPVVEYLLSHPELPPKPVRLLGVYASNLDNILDDSPRQLTLDF